MSPKDSSPAEGELLVLWELVQTARLAELAFRQLFSKVGLAPTQFGVLACLADGDDFTKAQLAEALLVRPQSVDPIVEDLIVKGLVRRDGPPRRGRAAGIWITQRGLDRLAAVRPLVSALNAPAAVGLSERQAATLDRLLKNVRFELTRAAPSS